MKRILLFVLPIVVIVAAGFTFFGVYQVRYEEEKLLDDLQRKARAVAESAEFTVRHVLINNDRKVANRLVDSFQRRERIQGCVIYGASGNVVAVTSRFSEWKRQDRPAVKERLDEKVSRGKLQKFKEFSVYSYLLPIKDDDGNVLGAFEVIYDTSYVFSLLTQLWKRISVTLIILLVSIIAIMSLIQWRIFTLPVKRLTSWFHGFQKGEIDQYHPIEKGDFGKLASEVEQVALSLRIARKIVSDKACERVEKQELWTEEKLRDLVQAKLGQNALFVVSNREPYLHVTDEKTGNPVCTRPASGVVTALDPILRACGGTWIAHGSGNADRQFVNSKNKLGVPPGDDRYILKRVWLSKEEEDGYYYGFSNEGLWPLCHLTHTRPVFREGDWHRYQEVNRKFAESVLEELPASKPFVFIQDYHFTLLGKYIKEKRPDATIALFWHIPWPNPEVFATCPYQKEILEGMLGCDLVGFHVQNDCNNFLDTANRFLESRVDTEKFSVIYHGKETMVRAFPISVSEGVEGGAGQDEQISVIKKEFNLDGKIVALGVDRIDYTKGIAERIMAVDRFLEKYPQYKNKFVFIQLAAPSRTHIKKYHDLMAELDELVEKKNWRYSEPGWKPFVYLKRHFSPEEIQPYYHLADICLVSSLHDGMNLVAKEYVISKSDLKGSLILSRFTGAARELTDAIQINPYSIEEFAEAIRQAVEMPEDERRLRMEKMRQIVRGNNIYRWAGNIISDLTSLKRG